MTQLELFAWLTLLFPLAGCVAVALVGRKLPGRGAGYLGTAALALSFASAIGTLVKLQAEDHEHRQVVAVAWDYAKSAGLDAQLSLLVDPLSVFMILVVSGVSTLIHVYSISYLDSDEGYVRFFAYLNFFVFSMLLLVLAGNFIILIVGWAFVGAASYMLISFWYRRGTATQAGIKAFVINVLGDVGLVLGTFFIFKHTGTVDFLTTFEKAHEVFEPGDADLTAGCILLLVGACAKSAQIPLHTWLPDAMEGPTPGQRADPRRDDGDRRRLPDRPHAPALRAGPDGGRRRRRDRLPDAARRRHDRDRRDRPQARHRLLDDVPDRLHDHGRQRGRLRRGPVPSHDARVLQGAAVHGGRLGDRRDGGPAEPRQDERLPARDAVHVRLHGDRRARARRRAAVLRLLLQGRDPAADRRPRRLVLGALRRRLPRRVPDRRLHVPDDLPRVLRRALPGGARARRGPPAPRRCAHEPGQRRGRGHRRRLPRPGAPHRRARAVDEDRDGHAGAAGDGRRPAADPAASRTSSTTSSSRRSRTRCSTSVTRATG